MSFSERWAVLFFLIFFQSNAYDSAVVKRDSNESVKSSGFIGGSTFEKSLLGGTEERNLEQEILQELNRLNSRQQREIFNDLEKQHEKFNASFNILALNEPENLSPLNVEELKTIRKTIKAPNSSLPMIRSKRTLNFLLHALARAMGYNLTPTNPDAEWIPRQQPTAVQSSPQPCSTPPPSCKPNPSSTSPPCAMPPTTPPCTTSGALTESPKTYSNQIDTNTISYPYRPARTIPLFNFAPLPAGIRVPYPPLLQPPAPQRSSCPPQQAFPPPCGATPAPSPPPCGATPAPSPPPCGATPAPSPPPCSATPAPSPPPCSATPAPSPPPCSATPAPSPPPCMTTQAPKAPLPCRPMTPPSPSPCGPTSPAPTPCKTTPASVPSPCVTPSAPPLPCTSTPAPCATPTSPLPPSEIPKKGSIILEYDDPVRIQIFNNVKKYLPASGSIYSGRDNVEKEDWHSSLTPGNEKEKKEEENYEEKDETEEEHIEEEEEEDETPGQFKHFEEEDESETSLSVVKKPAERNIHKANRRRFVSSKAETTLTEDTKQKNEKEDNTEQENTEKSPKMKKPKKKKWVRIVKKQRKKTKTDLNPQNNFKVYSADSFPESSYAVPKLNGKRDSDFGFDSFERDISDYSSDSSSHSTEDVAQINLKKLAVNGKTLHSPETIDNERYNFNINPFALEPEAERRKKLEKAVERYVEDYVEKQIGDKLIKNTGVPKTTVFEFAPKNGPKIQTITTTVAKTSRIGNGGNFKPRIKPETFSPFEFPNRHSPILRKNNYQQNLKKYGDASYEAYSSRK